MHCVSVYSRSDGIIGDLQDHLRRRTSGGSTSESNVSASGWEPIEVISGHYGMLVNPAIFYALADRLSQPEQNWLPFSATGLNRSLFP